MKLAQKHLLVFMLTLLMSTLACQLFSKSDSEPTPEPFLHTTRPELVFTPDTLPDAEAGVPYEVIIQISQFGVPEESGTYKFIVSVWCYGTNVSGQTGEKEYTLLVK